MLQKYNVKHLAQKGVKSIEDGALAEKHAEKIVKLFKGKSVSLSLKILGKAAAIIQDNAIYS